MKIILVYDIAITEEGGQKRLNRTRKIARKYLFHIQKSVFEGELTSSQVERLKKEISDTVDKEKDFVIIYTLPDSTKLERIILTNREPPDSNII